MAASHCGQELIRGYLPNLLKCLGYEQHGPTTIYEDNKACMKMSNKPSNPGASRHIDTKIYFPRDSEIVQDRVLLLTKVPTALNVADAFTTSLPAPAFFNTATTFWGVTCRSSLTSSSRTRSCTLLLLWPRQLDSSSSSSLFGLRPGA